MSVWIIASLTFRETLRRRALLAAIVLTLGFLALYGYGSYYAFQDLAKSDSLTGEMRTIATGEILLAGLFGVANIGALLAIFVAAGTIATEVEEGLLHAIIPRPLHRWEVVIGKWLGFALMVSLYVVVTGLATSLIIYWLTGYIAAQLPLGLLLIALKALLLLSLAMLFSTFLPALATGIVTFILYAVSNVAGMVEQLGYLIKNQTMINIGIISSLLVPSDSLWKMAASLIQPPMAPGLLSTIRQAMGPFSVANPPSAWMGLYALVYITLAMVGALLVFNRRDL